MSTSLDDVVNVRKAAEIIGCTTGRVRQLCQEGTLTGYKPGSEWLVLRKSAEEYRDIERKQGRKRISETSQT